MAWPARLGRELRAGGVLKLLCNDCGHAGSMPAKQAMKVFGELAMPSEVHARLRCSACGSKKCEART